MARAAAPGVVYIVGDKPFFTRTTTIVAAVDVGIVAEAVMLGNDRKKVEAETHDHKFKITYEAKRINIYGGGGRAKKVLRPVVIGASKTMDFLEIKAHVKVTLHYEPTYPLVAMPPATLSTATALATGAAIKGDTLDKDDIWKIAFETNRVIEGIVIPPIITAVITGGITVERWGHRISKFASPPLNNYKLLLVHSGREGHRKSDIASYWSVKTHYDNYLDHLGYSVNSLATEILESLIKGDVKRFGKLLNFSHSLLRAINASTLRADDLITLSLRLGAIGAKLVKINDGFIFSVVPKEKINSLKLAMERRSRVVKETVFSNRGAELLE